MSDPDPDAERDAESKIEPYVFRPWKVAGIVVAGILVAAGAILSLSGDSEPPTGEATKGLSPAGPRPPEVGESLLPGHIPTGPTTEGAATDATAGEEEVEWSPALLRGGLSFFLAFALGFAARAFLRIALFFVGIWAASLFFLTWIGWVEVNWDLMDAAFTGFADRIGDQFDSVTAFITGSLPSAGMAGLGLVTGLRRK